MGCGEAPADRTPSVIELPAPASSSPGTDATSTTRQSERLATEVPAAATAIATREPTEPTEPVEPVDPPPLHPPGNVVPSGIEPTPTSTEPSGQRSLSGAEDGASGG